MYFVLLFAKYFVQGYSIILARKIDNIRNKYLISYKYSNVYEIKSVNLIKLNKRLRLHHFKCLVGGINSNVIIFIFIDVCFIDKYLYLIFNLF